MEVSNEGERSRNKSVIGQSVVLFDSYDEAKGGEAVFFAHHPIDSNKVLVVGELMFFTWIMLEEIAWVINTQLSALLIH